MPISEKQLIANRQNALKSTGPRTAAGKLTCSRNATTHGIHARDHIIDSPHLKESRFEFETLVESLTEELKPDTGFQQELVIKIANCLWRQKRAMNAETAHLNRELRSSSLMLRLSATSDSSNPDNPTELSEEEERQLENLASEKSIPRGAFMLALLRYEMRLDIQLSRSYNLLRLLQSQQKTETLPDSYLA